MQNEIADLYQSPLTSRYASVEMSRLFSPQFKHSTWRRLWVALAESEKELGLDISQKQIDEMTSCIESIDFGLAHRYESQLHHDVMAHIYAYGDQCPSARSIIHLGATSCFVTDNTDTIQAKQALSLLISRLKQVITNLADFSLRNKETACLGFTHFQPAQLTTVGKRASLWTQDFFMDLEELSYRKSRLRFLGVKGATGTQASFLSLFNGNHDKVKQLDERVSEKMGFDRRFPVSGQTYTRKQDTQTLNAIADLGASCHKFATDLRLLAGLKELEEPFESHQIGSSAMPYKRNPMLSERICSLGRFLISLSQNGAYTHATQWLERSLDDSANRRLSLAESFLTADALLILMEKVTKDLVVNKAIIDKHIAEELPFMATENILMSAVKKGGDRQSLHEKIRIHSQAAADGIKQRGEPNHLLERIKADNEFGLTSEDISDLIDVKTFIGRSPEQVKEFIRTVKTQLEEFS
ncbi:Adenylosuccinate lyase [Waddlia chondrophila 2032/99]|uniref:Adenylosuccinate lyase n=1 Tax=Waddlia chondrophila 2032/99 TaxID=765953 RepID=F8LBE9_9BACT|nr:Adenylosuccinate lyase [Waddlia chondrophila 2032/99]